MTREQMIEELVEYEFQQITLVEVIQTFIKLRRELIDTTFSDDELLSKYNEVFGDAEAIH